jgi:uncharacterized short protein YbdD (DUF466 family)
MPAEPAPRSRLQRLASAVRRGCGMPDYDAHVAHLLQHPDRPVPSRREFFDAFVRTRYGDGPTRCC